VGIGTPRRSFFVVRFYQIVKPRAISEYLYTRPNHIAAIFVSMMTTHRGEDTLEATETSVEPSDPRQCTAQRTHPPARRRRIECGGGDRILDPAPKLAVQRGRGSVELCRMLSRVRRGFNVGINMLLSTGRHDEHLYLQQIAAV